MTDILRGNYELKKNIKREDHIDEIGDAALLKKKAFHSIGGSMVFVERKKAYWDGEVDRKVDKE